MNRLLRVLLLAFFLGPQLGEILLRPAAHCEEGRDCCAPEDACGATCAACACCEVRVSNTAPGIAAGCFGTPRVQTSLASTADPLPPPPTEILHVPKSTPS